MKSILQCTGGRGEERRGGLRIAREYSADARRDIYEHEYPDEGYYPGGDSKSGSGKLIGKWRSNGEALEPKWRDGDIVPLVPFHAASIQDRWKEDTRYQEDDHGESEAVSAGERPEDRRTESRQSEDQSGSYEQLERLISSTEKYSIDKDYEHSHRNGYKNFQSYENRHNHSQSDEQSDLGTESRAKVNGPRLSFEDVDNADSVALRYKEAFQNRPSEYDLMEDEYEKPRPRKRRPPQNSEFAEPKNSYATIQSVGTASTDTRAPWNYREDSRTERKPNFSSRSPGVNPRDRTPENTELKTLLKMQQGGGLSLSEILQQRNLTLADLLKGNANAIDVLKSSSDDFTNEDKLPIVKTKPDVSKNTGRERPRWMPSKRILSKSETRNPLTIAFPGTGVTYFPDRLPPTNGDLTLTGTTSKPYGRIPQIQRFTEKIISPTVESFTESPKQIVTIKADAKDLLDEFQRETSKTRSDDDYGLTSTKIDEDEIMEFSDFTLKKPKTTATVRMDITFHVPSTSLSPVAKSGDTLRDVGSTLSIEHILSSTEKTDTLERVAGSDEMIDDEVGTTEEVQRAVKEMSKDFNDSINTVNHTNYTLDTLEVDYQSDAVHQVSQEDIKDPKDNLTYAMRIDKDGSHDQKKIEIEVPSEESHADYNLDERDEDESFTDRHKNVTTNHRGYEDIISQVEPEARAEISELFSSGSSVKRLERLLKARNMSLEELIALRQRGSSQVHLAEAFRSREQRLKMQVPSILKTLENNQQDSVTKNITVSNRREKMEDPGAYGEKIRNKEKEEEEDIKNNSESTSLNPPPSTMHFDEHSLEVLEENAQGTTEDNKLSAQLLDLISGFDSLPFSKNIQHDSEGSSYFTSITDVKLPVSNSDPPGPTEIVESEYVKESEKKSSIDTMKVDVPQDSEKDDEENSEDRRTLSKVRPSIIASGAILGVTIVVFLGIFIVCRIRQKQKFTYRNTFSRAVFQAPMMTARKLSNTSSLNTIMVNVVATSTAKRAEKREQRDNDDFESRSDIENDSLDPNDSWETIPDFMK
ncbi:uncharacterized protein LOC112493817 isoform X2 [Cephus cinctus]|uniref:Uncharacterized protein LOC112493817 isoform X2 n=1 Tax=Cephus cinctus TaxID=211228 RepID=A0AAJ7R9X4_CEPCN|nr:uncharacterized protein LOC112493817 isoform X2 [Cephus cinctus]